MRFFSSPLRFNDLFDSQLACRNNSSDINQEKLIRKLRELGFSEQKAVENARKLPTCSTDSDLFHDVYHRQLERCGILCLTTTPCNPLMWGHYSRNEGFCIEYDTYNLEKYITFGFIDNLPNELISIHIERGYDQFPRKDDSKTPKRINHTNELFTSTDINEIHNSYLKQTLKDDNKILAFIKNIYLKRIFVRKVKYVNTLDEIARLYLPILILKSLKENIIQS